MARHLTSVPTSANHPTVDLPAYLEGPRLPTSYTPGTFEACPQHPAFEPDNCPGCGTGPQLGRWA